MKKVITLALLGTSSSLFAMYAAQASLYKDPRIMGMGGANIAVGSYSSSIFLNPAGLAQIKKEDGFVVDLLSVGVSATAKIQDFVNDINNANTNAQTSEVLNKYSGEHFHADVNNYTSISKNSNAFAWSIGLLAVADINLMAHGNGSSTSGLLETSSRAYGGVVTGIAKQFSTDYGQFDLGVGLKYISQNSYEGTIGVSELTNSDKDLVQTLQDKYEKKSTGYGLDLGVNYHPFIDSYWHPSLGLSVLNIGSMNMDDNYGRQPMTVNFGVAISPEVSSLDQLTFAVDYVDILSANTLRIYNYNENGDTYSYTDYDESNIIKKINLGMNIGIIDATYFSLALKGGMYQAKYTAGVDVTLIGLKINLATYEEQVGTKSVEISDRRYMVQVGIGW